MRERGRKLLENLKDKKVIGGIALVIAIVAIVMATFGFGRGYKDVVDDYLGGMAAFDARKVMSACYEESIQRDFESMKLQEKFDIVKEKSGGQLNSKYEIIDVRGTEDTKRVTVFITNYIDFTRNVLQPETTRILTRSKINGKWYVTADYDARKVR